jgi:hypothetical protein
MHTTSTDRRRFVALTGLGALAGLSGAAGFSSARAEEQQPVAPGTDKPVPLDALSRVPWPYQPLDPDGVAQEAFQVYQKGLCMRAVFEPIVRGVATRLGSPYTALPFAMFGYGAGGVGGWGTLCGTLNGAAAAFALLSANPNPLVASLFAWYEGDAIPDHVPAGGRFPNVPAVGGSVLCHASVAQWCRVAKKTLASPERFERCGMLAASVARRAVTLLNSQATGALAPAPLDGASSGCMTCHGRQGSAPKAIGRMRCGPCHSPAELAGAGHPDT